MTEAVCDWLPLGALTREPLREKISAAVSAWSAAWFSNVRLTASRFTQMPPASRADAAGWLRLRGALAVKCSERSSARLLDWALDADVTRLSSSPTDHRLTGAFARRLHEDLVLKLEEALGVEGPFLSESETTADPFGRLGGLAIDVSNEGDTLLSLALPLTALTDACKATLPPNPGRARKLTPLSAALQDAPVRVEAVLGAAHITLPELHALAPGDVIVLDTARNGAATLSLLGVERAFAWAKLTDQGGEMALTLQA